MATTQSDVRMKMPGGVGPRNSRRSEIVTVMLVAASALLALCLVSYSPNDASWSAAGGDGASNLIGAVGANVAAALFQSFGLAACMLPLLLARGGVSARGASTRRSRASRAC